MKRILAPILLLTLLFPALAFGETIRDLVKRDGIYYKKFSTVPFTGKTTGKEQGPFRNSKEHGPWVSYYANGQLGSKGTFKDGKKVSVTAKRMISGAVLKIEMGFKSEKATKPASPPQV